MSRQKAWSDYNRALRRILDSVKDPGTEIDVHGITKIDKQGQCNFFGRVRQKGK